MARHDDWKKLLDPAYRYPAPLSGGGAAAPVDTGWDLASYVADGPAPVSSREEEALDWQQHLDPKYQNDDFKRLRTNLSRYRNTQGRSEALGIDPEGAEEKGFLEAVTGVLDAPRSWLFNNVVDPMVTGSDSDAEGFGDLDALKYEDDDEWWERGLKATGAFVGDVATDPLTYLTFGAGTVGKKASTEAVELASKQLAERALGGADDAAKWASRIHPERLADEAFQARKAAMEAAGEGAEELFKDGPQSQADWLLRAQDEGAESLLREIPEERLSDLARDGFASDAATAYAKEKSRGLRKFLGENLGDDAGERAFKELPADLKGGVRFTAPFVREKSALGVSTPKSFPLTPGGGQLTDAVGLGRVAEGALKAQNRARALPGISTVLDKTSGRLGRMYGEVVRDLYAREDDVARVGWSKYQAARDLIDTENRWLLDVDGYAGDEQLKIQGLLANAPDESKAREAYRRFFHDPGDRLENLAAKPDDLDPSDLAGWEAAQRAHRNVIGRLGKEAHELFDGEMGWISEYVPRFMTREEKERRRRAQALTGRTRKGGEPNPTKQRERFAAELEYDEATGEVNVKRWMKVDEANEASVSANGTEIFKADPDQIVADYSSSMIGLMRRERFVRRAQRLGLVVDAGRTERSFVKEQAAKNIVGDAHQQVRRDRGDAERDLERFLDRTGRKAVDEQPLEQAYPEEFAQPGAPPQAGTRRAPEPTNADEVRSAEKAAARRADAAGESVDVPKMWDEKSPNPRPLTPEEAERWEHLNQRVFEGGKPPTDAEFKAKAEELSANIDALSRAVASGGKDVDPSLRSLFEYAETDPAAVGEQWQRWSGELIELESEWEAAEEYRRIEGILRAQDTNVSLRDAKIRLSMMEQPRALSAIDKEFKGAYRRYREFVESGGDDLTADGFQHRQRLEADLERLRGEEAEAREWYRLKGLAEQHKVTDDFAPPALENYLEQFDKVRTFEVPSSGETRKARALQRVLRDRREVALEVEAHDAAIRELQSVVDETEEFLSKMPDTMKGTDRELAMLQRAAEADDELAEVLETYNALVRRADDVEAEHAASTVAEQVARWSQSVGDPDEIPFRTEDVDALLEEWGRVADAEPAVLDQVYDEVGKDRPARVARIAGEDEQGKRLSELEEQVDHLARTDEALKEFLDAGNLPSDPDEFAQQMDAIIDVVGGYEARRTRALEDALANAEHIGDEEQADTLRKVLRSRQARMGRYRNWKQDVIETRDYKSDAGLRLMDEGLEPLDTDKMRDAERFADLLAGDTMRYDLEQMFKAKNGSSNEAVDAFVEGFWKPYYTWFKTWATVGRGPGFVARNVVGGAWNAFLRDVNTGHFKIAGDVLATRASAARQLRKTAKSAGELIDDATLRQRADREVVQMLRTKHGDGVADAYEVFHRSGLGEVNRNLENLVATGALEDAPMAARGDSRGLFPQMTESELGPVQRGLNKTVDNRWIKGMARRSTESEEFLRFATFLKGVDDYGLEDEGRAAGLLVKATQFDYADLDPTVEAQVLRQVMPFYVFTRRSVPLQFRGLMTKPGQVNKILRANEQAQRAFGAEAPEDPFEGIPNEMRLELGLPPDERELNEYLPEWVRERFGWTSRFHFQGNPITVGIESPAMDLNKWVTTDGVDFSEALSQINPLAKVGVESVTGTSLFTGAKMPEHTEAPLWAKPFGKTIDGERVVSSRGLNAVTQLLPPLSQADRLGGLSEASRERQLTSWLSNLAALPVSTLNPRQVSGELLSRSDDLLSGLRDGVPNYTEANELATVLLSEGYAPSQANELLEALGMLG